eukprot:Hpha_TRINITY_DN14385_c0_g1::TRINITY_DN14385_c0_g1_i1::g.86529::m.86529
MPSSADFMLAHMQSILDANRECAEVHAKQHPFAPLDCVEEPGISIEEFTRHVCRAVSSWELGMALVLVDRLTKRVNVPFSHISAHRLVLTALIISVKMQREASVMRHFSDATGLCTVDLRRMEIAFLGMMDCEVFVHREEVEKMVAVAKQKKVPERNSRFVPLIPTEITNEP